MRGCGLSSIRWGVFILCMLGSSLICPRVSAQGEDTAASTPSAFAADHATDSSRLPPWLRAAWGTTPDNGLSYLPWGLHSNSLEVEQFHLRGATFHSLFGGAFRNSFGDRSWALGVERTVVDGGRVHLNWWFGAMTGYRGRLVGSRGVPFSHSILFRHNVNPSLGFPLQVDLTHRLQIEIFLNPIASAVGVRVPFGDSGRASARPRSAAARSADEAAPPARGDMAR